MKPARRARKVRRAYRVSGFHTQVKALSRRGLSALDGRSALARAVRDWRAAVMADLGGEAELSQAELTLLDTAAQDVVLLAVADGWLRENAAGIVNRRRRAFVPLVEQRLRVATHLADQLKLLGLKRRAKPVPSLREILAEHAAKESSGSAAARPVGAGAAKGAS